MASFQCPHCSLIFDRSNDLKDHLKQLHSAKVSLKFLCGSDVVLVRDPASNMFICPGCDKEFEKYQQIYNHSKRVPLADTCHAKNLLEYLTRGADQDEAMNASDGPSTRRAEHLEAAVDSLMVDCTKDSFPMDSSTTNFDDIDINMFYSPYQETPPTTPKHTPNTLPTTPKRTPNIVTDDFNDVDMGAFYSPYKGTPPPAMPKPTTSNSEDQIMYTAAEKGKKRETSPKPLLHTASLGALPTEPHSPASEGPQFLSLSIPYGSNDILTTALLNTLNCVLYVPLRILICVVCSIAVQPRYLRRHRRGGVHMDEGHVSETLIDHLINDLQVLDGDMLQDLPLPFPAVPGIPFLVDGLKCPLQDCNHCRQSRKTMGTHIKSAHSLSIRDQNPTACTIQAIFDSNNKYYPVTLPQSPQAMNAPPNLDKMMETQYHHLISQIDSSALQDMAHLSPFLAKYKWHTVVADLEPGSLSEWTSIPRADEIALSGLHNAVNNYYQEIVKEMGSGESWTTVLRFVNTAKL